MTFDEAKGYLDSLNKFGSVLGLYNMRLLLEKLGDPQDKLKLIHVTGTNGKGSVCTYLSSILKESGYRVGAYNSPAVLCEYDQYKINCGVILKDLFKDAVAIVKDACDELNGEGIYPTRFEVETAAAFVLFEKADTDIAVIETGLGGRDDATAVIKNTVLHIFTAISEDHIPVLGDNIRQIADNKSHIIKSAAPTVAYRSDDETFAVIKDRCEKFGSPLYSVCDDDIQNVKYDADGVTFELKGAGLHNIRSSLSGSYQAVNASIAVKAAQVLAGLNYNITADSILCGVKNAYIPFRFEKLLDDPVIIADGAHNPDGAKKLIETINLIYNDRHIIFVTGIFKDKDYDKICRITGNRAKTVYAVSNDLSARSLDADTLANTLKKYNDNVVTCVTIEEGIDRAIREASVDDKAVIILFGSLSWLGRTKQYIESKDSEW